MELVYLWLEKFGDKSNQEINFNQNFKFSIEKIEEENYILNLKEKEVKIPDNYFGENINNISCIIGGNGSGKTSLIKEIFKIKNMYKDDKYLLIFKDNNTWTIKSNINKHILKAKFKFDFVDIKTNLNETYIYFANDYIPMNEVLYNNNIIIDISPKSVNNFKIICEIKKNITGYEYLTDTFNSNAENIAKFIIDDWEKFITFLPEKTYESLIKKVQKIKNGKKLWYELNNRYINTSDKIFEKLNLDKKFDEYTFLDKLAINIWDYIFESLESFQDKQENKTIENDKKFKLDKKESYNKNLLELYKLFDRRKSEQSPYKFLQAKFKKLFELEHFTAEKELLDNIIELVENKKVPVNQEKNILEFSYENLDEKFSNDPIKFRFFSFKFQDGFSSGEYSFLYLLEKIFHLKTKIPVGNSNKTYIFILEELESFLHPEWQRRLIELLKIIGDVCPLLSSREKIQFILTSHTPFLIGDLPQGNISKINDFQISNLNSNPLGANLLDILKEQFQLESLFGEFTREKIKKYLPKKNEYINEEELQFLIENIREPLIKNHLISLYEDPAEKRKRLEKELEKINKALEELGDKK